MAYREFVILQLAGLQTELETDAQFKVMLVRYATDMLYAPFKPKVRHAAAKLLAMALRRNDKLFQAAYEGGHNPMLTDAPPGFNAAYLQEVHAEEEKTRAAELRWRAERLEGTRKKESAIRKQKQVLRNDILQRSASMMNMQHRRLKHHYQQIAIAHDGDRAVERRWRSLIQVMTHPRGVWAAPRDLSTFTWTTDRTEGPSRKRSRLVLSDRPMPFLVPRNFAPGSHDPGMFPAPAAEDKDVPFDNELATLARLPHLFDDVEDAHHSSNTKSLSPEERLVLMTPCTRITPFAQVRETLYFKHLLMFCVADVGGFADHVTQRAYRGRHCAGARAAADHPGSHRCLV